MNQDQYKNILDPESGAWREAWLKKFSEKAVIGRIYGDEGQELFPGKSPLEWIQDMQIFSREDRKDPHLSLEDLRAKFLQIAQNHGTVSSFYAMLKLAAEALRGQVEGIEGQFIRTELEKYRPGGEFFDETTKKAIGKPPAKEKIEAMAYAETVSARKELYWYTIQAEFFQAIMVNLETQRRCLKDYAETHHLESRTY